VRADLGLCRRAGQGALKAQRSGQRERAERATHCPDQAARLFFCRRHRCAFQIALSGCFLVVHFVSDGFTVTNDTKTFCIVRHKWLWYACAVLTRNTSTQITNRTSYTDRGLPQNLSQRKSHNIQQVSRQG
jgi:hypothetical protein